MAQGHEGHEGLGMPRALGRGRAARLAGLCWADFPDTWVLRGHAVAFLLLSISFDMSRSEIWVLAASILVAQRKREQL